MRSIMHLKLHTRLLFLQIVDSLAIRTKIWVLYFRSFVAPSLFHHRVNVDYVLSELQETIMDNSFGISEAAVNAPHILLLLIHHLFISLYILS